MSYTLTDEGKEYFKNGLPEKNLIEFLKERKEVSLEEAKKTIKKFSIALQWAKKRDLVKIEGERLILTKYVEKIPEEDALAAIAKGEEVSEDLIKVLLFRKLIEKIKVDVEKLKELEGKEIIHLTPEIIKSGFWKKVKFKPYNVETIGKKIYPGKRHPYIQFLNQVRQKLVELGFKEMVGPTIETEFWNFDTLYQSQMHSARNWFSTFQLKNPKFGELPNKIASKVKKAHEVGVAGSIGWGYKWDSQKAMQLMPRAHGTCLSTRTLASKPEIPGKYFAIARCYRPDVIDPTHMVEFNQVEGIILNKDLNFRHLLGILKLFATEIVKAEEVKFYTCYFPFTEASVEMYVKHPKLGWIEIGGAGIFREEVTYPLGIKVPVLAWGLGIDRLAMVKLGVTDIRELFSRNLEWLRNQRVV
jgi:phenylalanyl-tRNA synthetase alpha chain